MGIQHHANIPAHTNGIQTTPLPSGVGALGDDPRRLGEDIKIAQKMLNPKARWPISDEQRERLVAWLYKIIEESDDDRARVRASSVVVEMDKLNMQQEERDAGGPVSTVKLEGTVTHKPISLEQADIEACKALVREPEKVETVS